MLKATMILLFIPFFSLHFLFAQNEKDDLNSLLNEADSVLKNKHPIVKENKPRKKVLTKEKEKKTEEIQPKEENFSSKDEPISPLKNEKLDVILNLDRKAMAEEKHLDKNYWSTHLSAGIQELSGQYLVNKDDDNFSLNQPSRFYGIKTGMFHHWNLISSLHWGLTTQVGFFQGHGQSQRTGIEHSLKNYRYQVLPLDEAFSISWIDTNSFVLGISYGGALDILRQDGEDQHDSFTELFWGDVGSLFMSVNMFKAFDLLFQYQDRGLLLKNKNKISSRVSGKVMTVGIEFPISG